MKCESPMGDNDDGCDNEAAECSHVCPFSIEVDNDYAQCDCCAECTEGCAEAI